jgi:hypothetical protein
MAKKKPTTEALVVKPKLPKVEEPVEVFIIVPRDEFPPNLKVIMHSGGRTEERSYSRKEMEKHFEDAVEICKKSGLANCHTWMEDLKIDYCAAVWIMDIMEYRKLVDPIKYKDGVAESSGPRPFTKKNVWQVTGE